jgi:hypothetical protein
MLYGNHERPWLPQGQFIGLVHIVIQLALTAFGFPPEQLHPRIDLFAYIAAALPHVLTIPAFVWAVQPIKSNIGRSATCLTLMLTVFQSRSGLGTFLAHPDYISWAVPVSLITLGWSLRLIQQEQKPSLSLKLTQIGLFSGTCLAIKPSYIVFPLLIGIIIALKENSTYRMLIFALGSLTISTVTLFLLTFTYYMGDLEATYDYYILTYQFMQNLQVGVPQTFWKWLTDSAIQYQFGSTLFFIPWSSTSLLDTLNLSILMPFVFLASLIFLPQKKISFALLITNSLSIYICYKRFYPVTIFESNLFFVPPQNTDLNQIIIAVKKNKLDSKMVTG